MEPLLLEGFPPSVRLEPEAACSVGQGLTYGATRALRQAVEGGHEERKIAGMGTTLTTPVGHC